MAYELTNAQADEVLALTTRICEDNVRIHELVKGARISEPTPDPEPDPEPTPPEPEPEPEPEPPTDSHRVTLTGDNADENAGKIRTALADHQDVTVDCGGKVRPINRVIFLRDHTLRFANDGDGLEQVTDDTEVIRAQGDVTDRVDLGHVNKGNAIEGLSSAYRSGDWVYIQSSHRYDNIHKYDDGFLRQLTDDQGGGRFGVNKPIPRTLTDTVSVFKVTLAKPRIVGGILRQRNPQNSYFTHIVSFLACQPTTEGVEVTQGGACGIFHALCADLVHSDVYVHDLIDDDDAQGWRREGDPSKWVSNPNGNRHYGYGIYYGQANFGGSVTGTITHCRHAVSTGDSSGKQRFFDGQNLKSGHPENIHHDLTVDSCWSSNISPHENGHDLTFTGQSIDPGRYANDHGSNDLQENPDHVNYRCDMTLRDFRCWLRDGTEGGRSNGISMGHNDLRTDGTQPTLTVDGVTIEGGRKGVDTRANLVIEGDGLTIRNTGSVCIHAQGEAHITGGPVTLEGDRATTVLTASTATVNIRE